MYIKLVGQAEQARVKEMTACRCPCNLAPIPLSCARPQWQKPGSWLVWASADLFDTHGERLKRATGSWHWKGRVRAGRLPQPVALRDWTPLWFGGWLGHRAFTLLCMQLSQNIQLYHMEKNILQIILFLLKKVASINVFFIKLFCSFCDCSGFPYCSALHLCRWRRMRVWEKIPPDSLGQ